VYIKTTAGPSTILPLRIDHASSELLRLSSDGVLQVARTGGAAPDGKLQVGATGTGAGAANTKLGFVLIEDDSGNGAGLWLGSMTNQNTGVIGSRTATGNIAFQTYNGGWGERARIAYTGEFLVGQTSKNNGGGASLQGNLATGAVGVSGSFATVWTIPSGTQGIFTVSMGGNGQYGGGALFFVAYGQFPSGGNAYVVLLAGPGGDQSGYGWSWQLASGGQFQMRNNTNTVPFVPAISMLTLA
jgi:hypothetical protein